MIVFVQARMSSRRLPGKVLRPMLGRPMLEYLVRSLDHSARGVRTVILTSNDVSDDPIAHFCHERGVECFRGSLEDVAARFLAACEAYGARAFARVSGDSPLLDFRLVDSAVRLFEETPCDLVTNVLVRTFPKGQSVEVMTHAALARAYTMMRPEDREHVTSSFYRHPHGLVIHDFRFTPSSGEVRMAVDTEEDFARVETCLARIGGVPHNVHLEDMLRVF